MLQPPKYELIRDDKLYEFTIPGYRAMNDSIYYQVHLKDLSQNQEYVALLRFKDFNEFHEQYTKLKLEILEFPKKHFWVRTNKNPQLIEQRRAKLQKYFSTLINDPFSRRVKEVKNFITTCKKGIKQRRPKSCTSLTDTTGLSRSNSFPKKGYECHGDRLILHY